MEFSDLLRMVAFETLPQEVPEQMMVAIPRARIVETLEEEVSEEHLLKSQLRLRLSCEQGGQLRIHPVEDRGEEQELQQFGVKTVEDVLRKIIADPVLTVGQTVEQSGDIGVLLQRQRCQLQGCDPPFGLRMECSQLGAAEGEAFDINEELACLPLIEAQCLRADLNDLVVDAQGCQRQSRCRSTGDEESELVP